MVVVACPISGCTYKTDDLPAEIIGPLLNCHALEHSRPQIHASRGPKLNRPTIDIGVDEETWNAFFRRWETFKLGSDISDEAASTQLFQCTSEALGDLLLKSDPRLTTRPLKDVLKIMRSLAVIPVARGVTRAELSKMSQSNDEPIRTFSARVRGKAETCGFTTYAKCQCGESVEADYTEEVIRDVILAGICDLDIRREALSMPGIQDKATNDVVSIIESREMARNATPLQMSSVSTMSSYKQGKQPRAPSTAQNTVPCPECRKPFLRFRERPDGSSNKIAYKMCIDCWRSSRKKPKETVNAIEFEENTFSRSQPWGLTTSIPESTSVSALQTKTAALQPQWRQLPTPAPCPTCGASETLRRPASRPGTFSRPQSPSVPPTDRPWTFRENSMQ